VEIAVAEDAAGIERTAHQAILDRVSVPMEEPRKRPRGRPRKDASKNPVARVFHMAYCGTVPLHDENGDALHTIRYGCLPAGNATGLRDRLVADAATLLSKRPDLLVELLCDGAPEMWNLLGERFKEETRVPSMSSVRCRTDRPRPSSARCGRCSWIA
jgi:hypothetical protein